MIGPIRDTLETVVFIDTCLPLGLRSAPFWFNQLANAIHWILENNYGVSHILHYLDNFLIAGPPNPNACANNLHSMLILCDKINGPIKPSKVEGPTTSLTFLGIQINIISMEASIISERKQSLLQDLQFLYSRHNCTKRELLSLIGNLSFSCKVLPAGRIFLRRLIDLSTVEKNAPSHSIDKRHMARSTVMAGFLTTMVREKHDSQYSLDF